MNFVAQMYKKQRPSGKLGQERETMLRNKLVLLQLRYCQCWVEVNWYLQVIS